MIGEEKSSLEDKTTVNRSENIDWFQRCINLELSLQQLRNNSNKIRQAFIDKVSSLESKAQEADGKVRLLEIQNSLLQERLMMSTSKQRSSPEFQQLQQTVEEKEKVISKLENEIAEQKKLRLQDAKQVEAKAAKIKEWVTSKLKELEEQNELLREENKKFDERLKILQFRMKQASPETKRKIETTISQLTSHYVDNQYNFDARKYSLTSGSLCNVIDSRRQPRMGKFSPKFLNDKVKGKETSSSSEDEMNCLSRNISSPKSRKPIPPPRSRLPNVTYVNTPFTPQLPKRGVREPFIYGRGGSLDRKLADMRKLNFNELREKRKQLLAAAADELHDYTEIYTPTRETNPFLEGRPPTPPLHRCPSWESRIYKIASTGINSVTSTPTHSMRSVKRLNFYNNLNETNVVDYHQDRNVPVFASIQGRASQIRSFPFSGDSSDSSDNETDDKVTTTATTSSSDTNDLFATPLRRVRRGLSVESALSEDYAVPPDAVLQPSNSHEFFGSDNYEPKTPKRFSSLQRETGSPVKSSEPTEKSGYLTKLGGRLRTWKRKWFVLKDGKLYYYRSQSDAVRGKPRGCMLLDETSTASKTEGSTTFQITTNDNKNVHYLTAESVIVMEEWMRVLQNTLKKTGKCSFKRDNIHPTIEGWLTKVKHGHSKKYWCVLSGKTFTYFKHPNDSVPVGQINMRQAKVEEVLHASDSDTEDCEIITVSEAVNTDTGVSNIRSDYTIAIYQKPCDSNPVYLLISDRHEMDSWLYHLTVVSDSDSVTGTQFEHIVAKIMQNDSPENSPGIIDSNPLWNDPILLYTKENIAQPLTTLPNDHLRNEAVKLFKSLQLFITVPLDTAGIDYHVSLLQNSLSLCITNSELQNELFCQLIKQTSVPSQQKLCGSAGVHQFLLCATQTLFSCDSSGTCSEKPSPTSNNQTISLSPLSDVRSSVQHIFVQSFQFLALAVSLFLPKGRILWLLKQHLRRTADMKTEVGKYAIYCQRALERTLKNGIRECKPSRMEVLGILLRNPYHHSLPHSIPVNFMNDTYMVVSFDGSTTVEEFVSLLNTQASIRPSNESGFALYSDDPIEKNVEHLLDTSNKLADIISRWESALREKHFGKFENTRVLKLMYKNRLYIKSLAKMETDKEKLLLAYQLHEEVRNGRFPVTEEFSLELVALLSQIEFGDYEKSIEEEALKKVIDRFYPLHFRVDVLIIQELLDKWKELHGISRIDCCRIYLNCARKWSLCGAKLFEVHPVKSIKADVTGKSTNSTTKKVWLAICDDAVCILELDGLQLIYRYSYKSILTFGGFKEYFMLVISKCHVTDFDSGSASGSGSGSHSGSFRTERLLFATSKTKILEMTYLIADYINAQSPVSATILIEKFNHETKDFTGHSTDKFATASKALKSTTVKPQCLTRSHTKL
ncbi:uncharacterized protein B4U80_00178 [Leptotrombidium deliense]|uniref:Uncharacterized protein n=1 Tax=Leptotrombidium deliense TaxID=299467 RepID=A0A443SSZ0_9ACAR|nr:uncharacterized protein B4U80_00178 [Leptotrombidium deliense]